MNQPSQPHSSSWVTFTYISFLASAGMVAAASCSCPWTCGRKATSPWARSATQSCITLTKTLRDNHEAARLLNRIEDARTERFLMEAGNRQTRFIRL